MIKKLAVYVCPLPGCISVSLKKEKRCPTHDKLLVREIYVHRGVAPGLGGPRKSPLAGMPGIDDLLGGL